MKNRNKKNCNINKIELKDVIQCQMAMPVQQSQTQRYYPLHNTMKSQFSFFLLKVLNNDVKSDDAMIRSVIAQLLDNKDR